MQKNYLLKPKILSVSAAAALLFAISTATPHRASAGSSDAIIGFGTGVLVGIGISNSQKKRKSRRYYRKRAKGNRVYRQNRYTAIGAANRNEVRQIQSALASLGFYFKRIDGDPGKGTRLAVRRYQQSNGYPATGRLSPLQKSTLIGGGSNGVYSANNNPYDYNQTYGNRNRQETSVFGTPPPSQPQPNQYPTSNTQRERTIFDAPVQAPSQTPPPASAIKKDPPSSPIPNARDLADAFSENRPPVEPQ